MKDVAPKFDPFNTPVVSGKDMHDTARGEPFDTQYGFITIDDLAALAAGPFNGLPKGKLMFFIMSAYRDRDGRTFKGQRERGQFIPHVGEADTGNYPLDFVVSVLRKIFGDRARLIIYATTSSQPDARRWRWIVAYDRPVGGYIYEAMQTVIRITAQEAGLVMCGSVLKAAQLHFVPNNGGKHYEHFDEGAEPVDLNALPFYASAVQAAERRQRAEAERAERLAALPKDFGTSPIGGFNAAHPLPEMLTKYGYKHGGGPHYRSPNQTSGSYATMITDDGMGWISLSSSDMAAGIGTKSGSDGIVSVFGDAFDLFAFYEHDNDRHAALDALTLNHRENHDGFEALRRRLRARRGKRAEAGLQKKTAVRRGKAQAGAQEAQAGAQEAQAVQETAAAFEEAQEAQASAQPEDPDKRHARLMAALSDVTGIALDGDDQEEARLLMELGDRIRGTDSEAAVLRAVDGGEPELFEGEPLEQVRGDVERMLEDIKGQRVVSDLRATAALISDKSWMVDDLPVLWVREAARSIMKMQEAPMPGLCALAMLMGLASAASRHWASQSRHLNPLNMMAVGVANSGTGKDVCRTFLTDMEVLNLRVTGSVTSEAALRRFMLKASTANTSGTLMIDEVWTLLAAIGGSKPNPNLVEMAATMMQLYNAGVNAMSGRTYAKDKDDVGELRHPAFNFFGLTVPEEWRGRTSVELMTNGFVARLIVVQEDVEPVDFPDMTVNLPSHAPTWVFERLRLIRTAGADHRNAPASMIHTDAVTGFEHVVAVVPPALRQTTAEVKAALMKEFRHDPIATKLIQRAIQNADKIAGLLAVAASFDRAFMNAAGSWEPSEDDLFNYPPVVEKGMIDYARRFITTTIREMMLTFHASAAAGAFEEEVRHVKSVIRDALRSPASVPAQFRGVFKRGLIDVAHVRRKSMHVRSMALVWTALEESAFVSEEIDDPDGGPRRGKTKKVRRLLDTI